MSLLKKYTKDFYSGDNNLKLLDQRYLPRWVVVVLDVFFSSLSLVIVYYILSGTPLHFYNSFNIYQQGLFALLVSLLFFVIYKTYSGIIRHSTFTDILKLAFATFSTAITLILINVVFQIVKGERIFLTTSILLYMFVSFTIMLLFRIAVKESYQFIKNATLRSVAKRVAIIGVDDYAISLGKALATESNMPFKLISFIAKTNVDKKYHILGKPVIPISKNFSETIKNLNVDGVLLISESFSGKERNEIVEACLENEKEVFNVPLLEKWNKKEDIEKKITPIDIEDLLERDPISIDDNLIKLDIENKVVLVTGGAGSIGSEIVKQVAEYRPKLLVVLDQAESALHNIEMCLLVNYPKLPFTTELADVSNMDRLQMLFSKYKFNVVYHAAAYKHVPMIEKNPHEAVYVNISGTVNLATLSTSYDVEKFVMISTDKAVNPTNVMGASKRIAEMYVQSLQEEQGVTTKFITTRFGNVLGSSGSVIPHFRKQISQGGPVTVTHKDIIRYFMMISEACQLVLQAGTMGNGGEIYVFDMGKPVKIIDLAKKMIRLSGFDPYVDIDIKITGLRPGEKLFEELLNDDAMTLPTHHPKIMVAKITSEKFEVIKSKVKKLIETARLENSEEVVKLIKELVPEYKSNNSTFEKLDKKTTG